MDDLQANELAKHLNRIDDQGESLIRGSLPWLINECLDNLDRLNDLLGPKFDRASKKRLRPITMDLRDQLKEIKRRID
jgi:hypothetical protein